MYVPPPGIGQGKLQTAAYQVWSEGNKNPCLKTSPLLTAETPSIKPTLWGIRQRYQGGEQYTDPFLCNSKPAPPPTRSCIPGLDTAQTRITDGDSSSIIPQHTATALFIKMYKSSGYPTHNTSCGADKAESCFSSFLSPLPGPEAI